MSLTWTCDNCGKAIRMTSLDMGRADGIHNSGLNPTASGRPVYANGLCEECWQAGEDARDAALVARKKL